MRKTLNFFTLLAATAAIVIACSDKPELDPNEIRPVKASEEIAEFFDDYQTLRALGLTIFQKVDQLGVVDLTPVDSCLVINSVSELPEVSADGISFKFPEIDFGTHTLIIGQTKAPHSGIHITSKSLVVEHDVAVMNLTLESREGFQEPMAQSIFFWGLYPKLNAQTTHTNATLKN
jgi:hypothetical protein